VSSGGSSSGGGSSGSTVTTPTQATTPSPVYHSPLRGPLSFGDRGDTVKELQDVLIQSGLLSGSSTGYYDSLTVEAVQTFQSVHNIVSSGSPSTTGYGSVGPRTLAALNALYAGATTTTPSTTSPTTGATTATPTPFRGTLSLGTRSNAVTTLQQLLNTLGFLHATPTGYYGPLTAKAVQTFQSTYNIVSSGSPSTTGYGSVGPRTWAKLEAVGAGR
jgi:peptidoglycan hydrolase-like protein with peptidoglycan-binding domain